MIAAEAMRKIEAASITKEQQVLLAEYFQQYALGDESIRQKFFQLVECQGYERTEIMVKSMFEEREERGKLRGLREANQELLTDKFGPLSKIATERIETMSETELKALLKQIMSAPSLAALGLE